jgi:endonuclease I
MCLAYRGKTLVRLQVIGAESINFLSVYNLNLESGYRSLYIDWDTGWKVQSWDTDRDKDFLFS